MKILILVTISLYVHISCAQDLFANVGLDENLYTKSDVREVKPLKNFKPKTLDYGVDVDQHYIESVKLEPFVIAMEQETMTLEIKVSDPNISSIEILDGFCQQTKINSGSRIDGLLLPNNSESITLYDDGSHGDKQANDMIFTFDSIGFGKTRINSPYYPNAVRKTTWKTGGVAENWHRGREQEVILSFNNGSSKETTIHMDHSCGAINLDYIEIPTIKDLDSTARMSEHVLNITGIEKQTQFPYYYAQGPIYDHAEVTKKVYEYVKDDYDWIIIQDVVSGRVQQYWPVMRNEQGVYDNTFDDSSFYGSEGKLRGVLYDESYWEPMVGINKQFGRGDYSTLNHEISHTWLSYLPDSLNISNDGHYNLIESKTSCFNGNGLYTIENIEFNETAGIATLHYYGDVNIPSYDLEYCNDLELYLMGLKPKEQVSPIKTLVNSGQVDYSSIPYIVPADGVRNVSIDEIIQKVGNRVPNYIDSQKSFKALMVVVHDRLLTDHEMALFEYRMQDYELERSENGKTFQHVTSDLATISTTVDLKTSTGLDLFKQIDGLAGLWYDPSLPGEGFNILIIDKKMIITYFGYQNNQQLWLISDAIDASNLKQGELLGPVILRVADAGTFLNPVPPSELEVWGTLSVTFDSCTSASFVLVGRDGNREMPLSQLAKTDGTNCVQ